ncbi:MAG: hypothetical protein H6551_03805 [Chitinophagales bacterium]|nr:hypothetical protein [Chitinophagaceae bacterium]MCB9064248.1 hypothetical protein [Chitinophagales bacterium]
MKKILVLIAMVFAFASCEKLLMPKPPINSPKIVFEELWKAVDEGYIYFKQKGLNWDSVHAEFKPKFFDTMTDRQLYDTCKLLLSILKDPNIQLEAGFARYQYTDTTTYPKNFNYDLLVKNYWGNYEVTGPFIHTIIDSIGYVYYGSMEGQVKDEHLKILVERFKFEHDSLRGMVFDIRNNKGGGDMSNLFTFAERLGVDTSFKVTAILFKTLYKNGPEKDDITDPKAIYYEQGDKSKFLRKFILLTNRDTRGNAALLTSAAAGFSNVKIYGDFTGGGVSRIVGHELPNGWQVRFPASMFLTDDDKNIENGLEPNEKIDMKASDEAIGHDTILDEAIKEIMKI